MTGWLPLLRLGLRRDRVLLPVWVAALVLAAFSSIRATVELYPDPAARATASRGVNDNPALVAIYGPVTDVDGIGGLATFKLLLLGGVFVALLCAIVVRRHTRVEEESGRAELLAGSVAGRHARLLAAVTEGALAGVVLGLLAASGNVAAGLDVPGSIAFGLAWLGLALSATGVTALAAQLSGSVRTVGAVTAGVLGGSYLLRGIGDVGPGWLTWVSPFGWASHLRAYGDERWWVFGLSVLLFVLTAAGAFALEARRDLGVGLLPERPGPAVGRLGDTLGLVLRQQRASLAGWSVVLLGLGVVLGGLVPSIRDFLTSESARELVQRVGGTGPLVDSFLATEISFVAVGTTALGIAVVVRLAGEEESGRVEMLLATGTSRGRLLGSTVVVALAAPALALLGFGVGAAVSLGLQGDGGAAAFGSVVPAALAPLPAIWLVTAIVVLLLGVRRTAASLGWALLALFLLLGQIGELIGLPGWVIGLSPFAHVPRLPAEDFRTGPELVLTLVAVALVVVAVWRYRLRDVAGA